MSNRTIAIDIIDYKKTPKEDFKEALSRMSKVDERFFLLCSSEAALKGELAAYLEGHPSDDTLIMPTVVHVLRGKRRLLQHPEFLFSIVGKVFDAKKVKDLLQSYSFTNEIDFMARYYTQYSNIAIADDVFYYEPSQDVIGRPVRPGDVETFLKSLHLFSEAEQKELLSKWTKTAKSRIEKERMARMIAAAFRNQKMICEEYSITHRIKRKIQNRI